MYSIKVFKVGQFEADGVVTPEFDTNFHLQEKAACVVNDWSDKANNLCRKTINQSS